MSRSVYFSPDIYEKPTIYYNNNAGGTNVGGNKKKIIRMWSLRVPRSSDYSPVRFLRRVAANVARIVRLSSIRSSCRVSSASMARSSSYEETVTPRAYTANLDSQRAEAIEDCIEFLNSSSSFQKSNSISSSH